jgi:phage-related protein
MLGFSALGHRPLAADVSQTRVTMTGKASSAVLGTIVRAALAGRETGIASHLAFGTLKVNQKTYATGLANHVAFGVERVQQRVHPPAWLVRDSQIGLTPSYVQHKSMLQYFSLPTSGYNLQETPRRVKLGFGDNYTQTYPDGLTPMDRVLTLSWNEIDTSDADRILKSLRVSAGVPFPFVAPNESVPRKWLATKWQRSHPYPDTDSLTITFEDRPYTELPS